MNKPLRESLAQGGGSSPTSRILQARAGSPMTPDAAAANPRWKTSQNGNKYLSHYGLKITIYPNRRGGWSACVKPGDAPPTYLNRATEGDARAAAEQEFIRLKASGQFRPPPGPTPREILKGVNSLKELGPQGREDFIELSGYLVREGHAADLFRFLDGNGYWVPRSQRKVARVNDHGLITIIASKWWWKRAEVADGGL